MDYFTEDFAGSGDDFDLANTSLLLTPSSSPDGYDACTHPAGGYIVATNAHAALSLGDDAFTNLVLTAGASVTLYGVSYTNLFVGSNGYVTFNSGDVSRSPTLTNHFFHLRIAGFLNDLNPAAGGTIRFGQESDRAVITYDQVPRFGTTELNSFQMELFFDGRIRTTWLNMQTAQGIVGVSSGGGPPGGFAESDLGSDYVSCVRPDNFTELFDASDEDIANTMFTFQPDGSENHYSLCREAGIVSFPVSPAGGTAHALSDDDVVTLVPVNGTLSFYGDPVARVFVSSNGRLTFDSGTTVYTESLLEHFSQRGISAYFRDLNPAAGGQVSSLETEDRLVVTYLEIPEIGTSNANSFQVELFFDESVASGIVRITYLTLDAQNGLVGLADGFNPAEVGAFTESDLSAAPLCPGSIGDQVWIDNGLGGGLPGDGIRNGAEEGIAGVVVRLLDPVLTNVLATTVTGPGGFYRFPGLAPGAYRIQVEPPTGFGIAPQDQGFNDDLDSDVDMGSGITLPVVIATAQDLDTVDAGLIPPSVSFSASTQTVAESAGTFVVSARLSTTSSVPFDIPFGVIEQTANEGPTEDFIVHTQPPLVFPPGTWSNTISVTVNDDVLDEADETFEVRLLPPGVAELGVTTAQVVTITDNDPPPELSIQPVTVNEGAGIAIFQISLNAVSGRDVTVNFGTVAGTAAAGSDFVPANAMVTVFAGTTNAVIEVLLTDDPFDEIDEMFSVVLSNLVHAIFAGGIDTATATIQDDDLPPELVVLDVVVPEDTGVAGVEVRLSEISGRDITVDFATSNLTAVAPSDYTATNGTLTVSNGTISALVTIPIVDDPVYELDETFRVDVGNVTNATLLKDSGTVVISGKPLLSDANRFGWSASSGWINGKPEGGGLIHCGPVLAGRVWSATLGWIDLGDGDPDAGAWYANTNATDFGVNHDGDGALTGYAWSATTGWIRFEQTHGKPRYDAATGQLRGYAWSATCGWINLGEDVTNSFAFVVDDPPPTIAVNDVMVNENDGTAIFTVARSGSPTAVDVRFQFTTANQTAIAGQDYTATSGMVTLPAATNAVQVEVPLLDDSLDESNEVFTVQLSQVAHATVTDSAGMATILDDGDAPPGLDINSILVHEDDGLAEFTVSLTALSGKDIRFLFGTSNITAAAGSEYVATNGTAVIQAGQLSATIQVVLNANSIDDADSQFAVVLTGISNAIPATVVGIATIQDDDPLPFMSIHDLVVTEDAGTARFPVVLSSPSGRDIGVRFATTNGTAMAPADYAATNGMLTLAAGVETGFVDVAIAFDNIKEPFEQFGVSLSLPVLAVLADDAAIGTITQVSTLSTNQPYSWAANTGWIHWRPPGAGAVVTESVLCGYLWSATTGWMCLGDGSPTNGARYGNLAASDFGVNRNAAGELSGYAWSAATGWVHFEQAFGKPKINGLTGRFSGYAWSATTGWINLGDNTSHYVQTDRIEILDSDGDGMDDAWERDTFMDLTTAGPGTDFDGDGAADLEEYLSDTEPKNSDSFLRATLLATTATANTYQLDFTSSPARLYRIEVRTALATGTWTDSGIGPFAPDAGTLTTRQVTLPAASEYFFRVVAVRPLTMNP